MTAEDKFYSLAQQLIIIKTVHLFTPFIYADHFKTRTHSTIESIYFSIVSNYTCVKFNSMRRYSEVFSNNILANLFKFGSWGSRGSKLLVLVDRVGPVRNKYYASYPYYIIQSQMLHSRKQISLFVNDYTRIIKLISKYLFIPFFGESVTLPEISSFSDMLIAVIRNIKRY